MRLKESREKEKTKHTSTDANWSFKESHIQHKPPLRSLVKNKAKTYKRC